MFSARFLRSAAIAFGVYGVFGLLIAAAMLVVGSATMNRIGNLSATLEHERLALVQSIHTASSTLRDSSSATTDFQKSIDSAGGVSDQASTLANDSAGTFRDMSASAKSINILGIQPLAAIGPQFDRSADQLQLLAISLGSTRDVLRENSSGLKRVGNDLNQLQAQLDLVAASLSEPGVLGLDTQAMAPFQLAFFGMCLLVILQSAFSIVAGITLYRLARRLGGELLFPHARALEGPPPASSRSLVALERGDQLRDIP